MPAANVHLNVAAVSGVHGVAHTGGARPQQVVCRGARVVIVASGMLCLLAPVVAINVLTSSVASTQEGMAPHTV